jgi:beta-lactamase regulating signal transducer with metallopeptidase domain
MLQAGLLESCEHISSAVVHFGFDWLLQSTLLVSLGLLAAKIFRPKGTAVQSVIYRMTLAAALACPIVSLLLGTAGVCGFDLNLIAGVPAAASRPSYETISGVTVEDDVPVVKSTLSASGQLDSVHSNMPAATGSALAHQPSTPQGSPERIPVLRTAPAINWSASLHVLLAVVWLLGSSVFAIRLYLGWRSARQLCRSSFPADADTAMECRALAARMGIRTPQVLRTGFAASPSLVGIFRPVVLLPEEENTQADDREVLVHELAHLARGDQVWGVVGRIGTAVLFFQPLVWLLVRRMVLAAEEVCDDYVILLGFDRPAYARRLVEVAERYQPAPALALGMVSLRFQVSRRVVRILDSSRQLSTRTSRRARVFIVAATLVGTILAGALSVGNRVVAAPGAQEDQHAAQSGVSKADDFIDTTYMIEKASAVIVMRPAAAFVRPEMAVLAKLLQPGAKRDLLRGGTFSDFRQITVICPEANIPWGLVELVVYQSTKPLAASSLQPRGSPVKALNGKKLYGSPGGLVVLQYDDHTIITAGSEQAMGVYLAGNVGVLPKCLSAKAWESFRGDQFIMAGDAARMRRDMKPVMEQGALVVRTALLASLPLWENATWLACGARLDDKLTVHAWAAAKDVDSSAEMQRTAEALKTLAQGTVKGLLTPSEPKRQPNGNVWSVLLDEGEHLLKSANIQRDGSDVKLYASVELDKARLGTLVSAVTAAIRPADPSTQNGIMALVEDFFHHNYRNITSRETIEWGKAAKTKDGNFSIRYKYRARYWGGEPKIVDEIFTFSPTGQFVSVDYAEKHPPASPAAVYEVRKRVSDFPDREDLTTPEAAYASIHRAYAAHGDAAWAHVSVPTMAPYMQGGTDRPLPKEAADRFLGAEILEVHVWERTHAVVIAREGGIGSPGSSIDIRSLTRVDGHWLNNGNDRRRTVEEARQLIDRARSH